MNFAEPPQKLTTAPYRGKKHSLSIRIWHWLNAIIISGSLITVLINATLTNKKTVKPLVIDESGKNGPAINEKQATDIAHALSDKLWNIHIYFGYTLAALLAFRLIMEAFQVSDQKLIRIIKHAYAQFKTLKTERSETLHDLLVKMLYAFFYLTLIVIVITGLSLAFEPDFLKPLRHSIKTVHGFCMYIVLGFILIHITGVIRAEHKQNKGIVSDMINGGGTE